MQHRRFTQLALALSAALALSYVGCGSDSGGDSAGGKGGAGTGGAGGSGTGGTGKGGSGGTGAFNFGGTGNTTSGGGSGGTGAAPDACAVFKATSELVPANLLLVIDRSGSMTCNLPRDGQTTANATRSPRPTTPPSRPSGR